MKRKSLLVMTMALAIVLFSFQAWATPLNLTSYGNQPSDSGEGTILAWLNGLIAAYNIDKDPNLPTDVSPDFRVNTDDTPTVGYPSFGNDTLEITLPANLNNYVVFHWGGQGGGSYQAFNLTNIPEDSDTFNAPGQNGLSWYAFYGTQTSVSVPEPSILLLLGSALLGLGGLARRFRKN